MDRLTRYIAEKATDTLGTTDWKDIVIRAVKTFVQTFLATWALSDFKLEKVAIIGAGAAGISAVWNFIKETA